MDLDLSDDQRLLQDMVERFAADAGGLDAHRAAVRSARGWSPIVWKQMAELGLVAIPLPESAGGLGGGGTELMIVGEAFGRHHLDTPFLDTAVVAGTILAGTHGDARDAALARLTDGTHTFALIDSGMTGGAEGLSGFATGVFNGGGADMFIVLAEDALWLVASDASGVTREDYALHGGGHAADIRFDRASSTRLAGDATNASLLDQVAAARVVYLAAEALGLGERALAMTVDYLKTRVQFGTPIGTNQSLQHRAAEMFVEIEQMRSAAILAACTLDDPDTEERTRVTAAVSLVIAKAARFVAQQAVQLHGGIGVTEEHAVGHQFLRLSAIALLLNGDAQLGKLAALGGFVAPRRWARTAA